MANQSLLSNRKLRKIYSKREGDTVKNRNVYGLIIKLRISMPLYIDFWITNSVRVIIL
jgi:hypothetical protein